MMMNKRVSVRLTENQMLVLTELKNVLNCNISLVIRFIIGHWLTENEDRIYDIIDGKVPFDKNWLKNDVTLTTENDSSIA